MIERFIPQDRLALRTSQFPLTGGRCQNGTQQLLVCQVLPVTFVNILTYSRDIVFLFPGGVPGLTRMERRGYAFIFQASWFGSNQNQTPFLEPRDQH
jgi:hypothetical protein